MAKEGLEDRPLTIGALSRATRIPVETLRTWERRYLSPTPIRKPSGHRLYAVGAVEHLRRVARLLERGHRPGELLRMNNKELDALLALGEESDVTPIGRRPAAANTAPDRERSLNTMIRAAKELDRDALLHELQTIWARLGPLDFLETIAAPFLVRLGEEWHQERIQVRHEHLAFGAVADFLRAVRDPFENRARGPRVIAATPPGEQHEGGLLMASLVLSLRGRRLVYLGPSTPVSEISAAARESKVEAAVISVSTAAPASRTRQYIAELRRALPRSVSLWVGGAGAPSGLRGADRFETIEQLDQRLSGR